MQIFPRCLVVVVLSLSFVQAYAQQSQQAQQSPKYYPAGLNVPPPEPDLFEVSLGFNYIYLDNQFPETKNLYGVEVSAFVNATSWLAAGGEFMADFGSHSVPVFFRRTVDIDSQRYVYVFGPRITVWHDPHFKVFVETLAGGVHAEAQLTSPQFSSVSQSASADGFAAALGAGFDWRLTNHVSWRIVQADYLPTRLGGDWQNNFRASTAIVYSFGRR
jgi:hypothetical protein